MALSLQHRSPGEVETVTADLKPLMKALSTQGKADILIEENTVRRLIIGFIKYECICSLEVLS